MAGDAEVMAAEPRTGADTCQAEAPTGGHTVGGTLSNGGPAEVQPRQASGAVAYRAGVQQTVSHPVGDLHFGLQTTASGAVFVDQSRERGSESRLYGDTRSHYPFGGREYRRHMGLILRRPRRVSRQFSPQLSLPQR